MKLVVDVRHAKARHLERQKVLFFDRTNARSIDQKLGHLFARRGMLQVGELANRLVTMSFVQRRRHDGQGAWRSEWTETDV